MAITTTQNAFTTIPAQLATQGNYLQNTKNVNVSKEETKKEEAKNAKEDSKAQVQKAAQELDSKSIVSQYVFQFSFNISINTQINFGAQSSVNGLVGSAKDLKSLLNSIDTSLIGYTGKPLANLTQEEAKALISEGGFFSIENTAERIAEFVLKGAGNDAEKLQAGREGILRGFKQAESQWGEDLPEISHKTLEQALVKVDEKLAELGSPLVDANA